MKIASNFNLILINKYNHYVINFFIFILFVSKISYHNSFYFVKMQRRGKRPTMQLCIITKRIINLQIVNSANELGAIGVLCFKSVYCSCRFVMIRLFGYNKSFFSLWCIKNPRKRKTSKEFYNHNLGSINQSNFKSTKE